MPQGSATSADMATWAAVRYLVIQEVGGVSSVPSATLEAHGVVFGPERETSGGLHGF